MEIEIFDNLKNILVGKVVILGMGNPIRGDDAFGSLLAEKIAGKTSLTVLNGGSSPENLLGKIIQESPEIILFVDAVDFGGKLGEVRLFNSEEIKTINFFSTHNFSLRLVFDFLKENTQAKIFLLAIQPKSISLGEKISPEVKENLDFLTNWLLNNFPKK